MMWRKLLVAGAAALLMAHSANAHKFYGLASAGLSDWTGDDADAICGAAARCEPQDTAFKVLGGYKLAVPLAAEAGYWNFGQFTAARGVVTLTAKASGFGGGIALHHPFSPQWLGVARLGLMSVRTRIEDNFNFLSESESSMQLYGGLSLGVKLAPNILLEGSWDISAADVDRNSFELNALSLGLHLMF
jgi:hypothetical protein